MKKKILIFLLISLIIISQPVVYTTSLFSYKIINDCINYGGFNDDNLNEEEALKLNSYSLKDEEAAESDLNISNKNETLPAKDSSKDKNDVIEGENELQNIKSKDELMDGFLPEEIKNKENETDEFKNFIKLANNEFSTVIKSSQTKEKYLLSQNTYQWEIIDNKKNEIGNLNAVICKLKNNDKYYFLEYTPNITSDIPARVNLQYNLEDFNFMNIIYPENDFNISTSVLNGPLPFSEYNFQEPSTTYINSQKLNLALSYTSVFTKQENDVLMENCDLAEGVHIDDDGNIQISFPNQMGSIVQQWGFISENEDFIDFYDETIFELIKIADLNKVRKWCNKGQYNQIYESYYPYSPYSYWRIPAHHIGNAFLINGGCRFFEDFSIIAAYSAVDDQNKAGYWYSTPRSNWLFDDYGIDSFFYDTRFCTDAGLFLLRSYKKYNEPVFLECAVKYGEFLMNYAADHHFSIEEDGWLVYDYTNYDNDLIATHCSLNHHVTEMNFLIELYIETKNQKYTRTIEKMLNGIKYTKEQWVKENNDLWYAYAGSSNFVLDDYPDLTLKDLTYLQNLLYSVYNEYDSDVQYLIDKKQEYLYSLE